MTIDDIKELLQLFPNETVLPVGFGNPHSWRSAYDEPAVEIQFNVPVKMMKADLKVLTTATFRAWKGGEYEYKGYHELHLDWDQAHSPDLALAAMLCMGDDRPPDRWGEPDMGLQLLQNFLQMKFGTERQPSMGHRTE